MHFAGSDHAHSKQLCALLETCPYSFPWGKERFFVFCSYRDGIYDRSGSRNAGRGRDRAGGSSWSAVNAGVAVVLSRVVVIVDWVAHQAVNVRGSKKRYRVPQIYFAHSHAFYLL